MIQLAFISILILPFIFRAVSSSMLILPYQQQIYLSLIIFKHNTILTMLNIPQLQQQWIQDSQKDYQSPCPTNFTSFSDSLHLNSTTYQHLKNQRKYSHPPHRSTDWTEVERSVFGWFDNNKITLGHPEQIIEVLYEESKREVARKLSGDAMNEEMSSFQRKRGRKLTISI